MYTVSFLHTDGSRQTSRYFERKAPAVKWARWLRTTKFVVRTFLYRGPEGGELLEDVAA